LLIFFDLKTTELLEVDAILNNRDVRIDTDGNFKAIPFTASISSSLGVGIDDERLLHLIVTDGEAPSIHNANPSTMTTQLPVCPIELSQSMIPILIQCPQAVQSVTMGEFTVNYNTSDRKNWKEVQEGERHCKVITIIQGPPESPSGESQGSSKALKPQIPTVLLGMTWLNFGSNADDMQLLAYVSNIHPDKFTIHFDSFGRTLLYVGRLSWMAISPHPSCLPLTAEVIHSGVVDSQLGQPRKLGRRYTQQQVSFPRAYERTPNVFSCLAGFNIGGSGSTHWDIRTFVTGIDREGFTLHIEKITDSEKNVNEVVANAQASWVAFPSGGTGQLKMICGEFHLGNGERVDKGKGKTEWHGRLTFTEVFASPPCVFVAFASFDINRSSPVRLAVAAENISREGMGWKIWTWADTAKVINSATCTYLAVANS
jgi:H-type lectin domain